jgi:hypothetical protein
MRELVSERNFQVFLRVMRSTLKGYEIHAHRPLIFFLPSLLESGLFAANIWEAQHTPGAANHSSDTR